MNYCGEKFRKILENVFILEFLRKNREKMRRNYKKIMEKNRS